MKLQYNVGILYGSHSGVYSSYNTLPEAHNAIVNYAVYYAAIGKPINIALIESCCANCEGLGQIRQALKRRYQGKNYKMVVCPECKGKGIPETIYSYENMPKWVKDGFK